MPSTAPSAKIRRGFTLLELIVVLVVLGLLAAIAIPTYNAIVTAADERSEAASWAAIGRAATATAAADRALPPGPQYFQAIIDETDFTAAAEGLLAQGADIIVVEPGDPTNGAARVFYWGARDGAVAIISPSETTDTKCVAVAVTGNTVDAGVIDPVAYEADESDPIADQCVPDVALNWALDESAPVEPPPSTTTTEPEDPEDPAVIASVPTGLAGTGHSSGVDLTWDAVAEAGATYDIARDGTTPTVEGISGTSYGDIGLDPSTTYTYRVRACVDECSAWSDEVSVTTAPPAPAAPTGFAFTDSTSNTITFAWNADAGADTYEVQRQGIAEPVSTTGTTYAWSGLAASVNTFNTYSFRVRSCNVSGCSAWTDYAAMTTAGYQLINAASSASSANSTSTTGSEASYTIPAGVKRVYLQAIGGRGANGARCSTSPTAGTAGAGANIRAVRNVTPGDTLEARAGKQGRNRFGGWPGGGNGAGANTNGYCSGAFGNGGGAGGGYSRWVHNGTTILIGAGGGGGGSTVWEGSATGGNGGNAGGGSGNTGGAGGAGGSGFGLSVAGGAGGSGSAGSASAGGSTCVDGWTCRSGVAGSAGTGGRGGIWTTPASDNLGFAGGGGGGYGGGGGGGTLHNSTYGVGWGGGGGGGSSYGSGVTSYASAASGQNEGAACMSWHGSTGCIGGGSTPFVP